MAPLIFVVGTRAQLIKIAPVVVACERLQVAAVLLMTGQHSVTMQDLIEEFGISSPQISAIPAEEHATVHALIRWLPAAYRGIKTYLRTAGEKPTVLVHGDTLSTLVGALAARRCKAQVIHLESGLSSGRLFNPFPEELCRRWVFRMTDVAMCPNPAAAEFMQRHTNAKVVDTDGNTITDAVALTGAAEHARQASKTTIVASLHRFQNIYDTKRLFALVTLLEALSKTFPVHFVLHPATLGRLTKAGLLERLSCCRGIQLLPRMGYRDFLHLAADAACVLTDGGSNQEELAALGVPTIVMRACTERPDGLGQNAIMEANVPGGVLNFILGGGHEKLRHEPASILAGGEGPSERIIRATLEFIGDTPLPVAGRNRSDG